MNKCHTTIEWHNDTTPAINETHLNQYDGELDTLDDRIIVLDTTKANQSDLLTCVKNITYTASTGTFRVTLFDNTYFDINTDIEKVAINFDYDDDPTSAHYQQIIIELDDGTYKYIDLSALITEYEFGTTDTIAFNVAQDGTVTANVRDGSITEQKLRPNYLADITTQANAASASATTASEKALVSEGYANGEQNGVPVSSTSPYSQKNSKYWAEQAETIAEQLWESLGVSVAGTQLVFSAAFEASYSIAVVGTQLQISTL